MEYYIVNPTLKNVVQFFANEIIPSFSDENSTDVDLKFEFTEEKAQKLFDKFYSNNKTSDNMNTIKVKDHIKFFNLLKDLYECEIDYYEKFQNQPYDLYRMKSFFKDLWLRLTNLDFEDIESFLEKQIEMYKDKTFENYNEEKTLCSLNEVADLVLSVKNRNANTWDESPYELCFRLYDDYYIDSNYNKVFYELPKVRYGIYEHDGNKVCRLGSIQSTTLDYETDEYAKKKINRLKYKIIDNKEDFEGIEPNKVLSFMLFLKMLKNNGIDKIEIPALYILDYNYHLKMDKVIDDKIKEHGDKKGNISVTIKDFYDAYYGKEDIISKSKSEDLFRIGLKAKDYMDEIEVLDMDNRILLDISKINSDNINNDFIKYLYKKIGDPNIKKKKLVKVR